MHQNIRHFGVNPTLIFSFFSFFFSSLPFSHQTEGNTSIQLQVVQHTVLLFLVDFCRASRAWSQPCSFTEPTPTQTRASSTGRWARLRSQLWLPGSSLFFFSRLAQPSSLQYIRLTKKGWVLKGVWFSSQRFDTLTHIQGNMWGGQQRKGTVRVWENLEHNAKWKFLVLLGKNVNVRSSI